MISLPSGSRIWLVTGVTDMRMGNRLRPLYEVLSQYVLQAGKVHTDDTPVRVLEPGSGKTRTGRLWVYVRDDRNAWAPEPPAVWFSYSSDQKGVHPQRHLADTGVCFRLMRTALTTRCMSPGASEKRRVWRMPDEKSMTSMHGARQT